MWISRFFVCFHLVSVISWLAALLYLPRLLVYYAETSDGLVRETLFLMQYRLLTRISFPACFFTLLSGSSLAHYIVRFGGDIRWLHIKVFCVLLLVLFQWWCAYCVSLCAYRKDIGLAMTYRVMNEFPTIMMIICIILVIFKPSL